MRKTFKMDGNYTDCDGKGENSFCSLNGKSQPSVKGKLFFGISQFRDVHDYFALDDTPVLIDLLNMGTDILNMNYYSALQYYDEKTYYDFYTQYFELFYLYVLLTDGYEFSFFDLLGFNKI